MSTWPQWRTQGEPAALTRYVRPDIVQALLPGLPGLVTGNALGRLEAVYTGWAAAGVQYALEPPYDDPAFQAVRPPDQVLIAPRHATCLDAAVTFAGACLAAGVHPLVVVADSETPGADPHAVVVVWLEGSWAGEAGDSYPFSVTSATVGAIADQGLRERFDDPGAFVAIDPSAATGGPKRPPAALADAVSRGRTVVLGRDGWRPRFVVDVGLDYRPREGFAPPGTPARGLQSPYADPSGLANAQSLKRLRAEYGVVPFQGRDEFDALWGWCTGLAPGPSVHLALVTGVGGSGKTRLVAELAERLAREGWHTGFVPAPLPRTANDAPADEIRPLADWLATTKSPLLLAVDYAESRWAEVARLMASLGERPGSPTCVVLTARELGGWWKQLEGALTTVRLDPAVEAVAVQPRPDRPHRVFRRAVEELGRRDGVAGVAPQMPRMHEGFTTLDVVLVAWLVALFDAGDAPRTRLELYDEVLGHERRYWKGVFRTLSTELPPDDLFDQAAVVLTMVDARPERAPALLRAVARLDGDSRWREHLATALGTALATREGAMALTPDPVADHLAILVLAKEAQLFADIERLADEDERLTALVRLTRASARGATVAREAASLAVSGVSDVWRQAFAVAGALGGPCVDALVALVLQEDTPLPLSELADGIPLGHGTLRSLAAAVAERLVVDQRRAPPEPGNDSELARRLNNAANRLSDVGRRDEALGAIEEAVAIRRRLAEANPAAFLPDLAMSLNNQANRLSEVGRRDQALGAIEESVAIHRRLAEANPAAFLPNLATSLNNQANLFSEVGRRDEALGAWEEAIGGLSDKPGPAAELVAWRCAWRFGHADLEGARADAGLVAARTPASDADLPFLGRARQRVRAVAAALPADVLTDLPSWATMPISDDAVNLVESWASVAGSLDEAAFLTEHSGQLAAADIPETLAAMADLFPEHPMLARAQAVVAAVGAGEFEQILATIGAANEAVAVLRGWMGTPSWAASRAYFEANRTALQSDAVTEVLGSWADQEPAALQHLALLRLAGDVAVPDLFDAVADGSDAVDLANDALVRGQPELLGLLLTALPALAEASFYGSAVTAVALADVDRADEAASAIERAAAEGDPTQRRAFAARLRRLVGARPDRADRIAPLVEALERSSP